MGALHIRPSFLITFLLIPLIAAQNQDLRTSTFLPLPSLPSPVPSLLPIPVLGNTLIVSASAAASSTIYAFPSPLPSGVAQTASHKPIPCSPKNVKLNPSTHKLISECTETMFCAQPPGAPVNATGLGMCFPRLCRRDEYPFGYGNYGGGGGGLKMMIVNGKAVPNTTVVLPPMCENGTFCPDNGSECRPQVLIGGRCELGRDEQCAPPPASPNVPAHANKAICLNLSCMPATQELNIPCTIENTTYVSDINRGTAGAGLFTSFVIKHDCLSPQLFCDPTALHPNGSGPTCQKTKKLAEKCAFDAECELNNCASPSNVCALPPQTTVRIAPWHWVATILFIVLAMASTFLVLMFIHRRHRYARYQELQEYYHEQMSLRRAILALHAAAAERYGNNIGNEKHLKEKQEY